MSAQDIVFWKDLLKDLWELVLLIPVVVKWLEKLNVDQALARAVLLTKAADDAVRQVEQEYKGAIKGKATNTEKATRAAQIITQAVPKLTAREQRRVNGMVDGAVGRMNAVKSAVRSTEG